MLSNSLSLNKVKTIYLKTILIFCVVGTALREETAEMLIQQGLEEIANVSTSEQIAFLLVERARLLDELEAEQNRTMTPSVDGRASEDLQRTLEKERNEFEEEIAQHRDNLKKTKDQMKRQHEEEINALMEENNKLEDDLVESKEKVGTMFFFQKIGNGQCV